MVTQLYFAEKTQVYRVKRTKLTFTLCNFYLSGQRELQFASHQPIQIHTSAYNPCVYLRGLHAGPKHQGLVFCSRTLKHRSDCCSFSKQDSQYTVYYLPGTRTEVSQYITNPLTMAPSTGKTPANAAYRKCNCHYLVIKAIKHNAHATLQPYSKILAHLL